MSRPVAPRSRVPAGLEIPEAGPASHDAVGGGPRWLSGLLAGMQGALLSLLVVSVPALAAYVATSADPANADVGWPQSLAVGAALWLLGHGGALQAGDATITIIPLGITVLAVLGAHASAARSAYPGRSAWAAGVGGYLVVAAVVTALAGATGPLGAGWPGVLRTAVGASLVAAVGLGAGMVRPSAVRATTRPAWSRVPPLVRSAVVAGAMAAVGLVGVAALVTATWMVTGRAGAGDVITALDLDVLSGVLLAFAQLAVVANLVLWATGWVAGPGFAVGAGTSYAPGEIITGPMPALPMLGGLPADGSQPAWLQWFPVVVVGLGVLAGWWLHRRLDTRRWWEPAVAAGVAAVTAAGLAALGALASGGTAGPGRMGVVGAHPGQLALAVGVLVLGGAVLGAVPTDAVVRERCGAGARRVRVWATGLRGSGDR